LIGVTNDDTDLAGDEAEPKPKGKGKQKAKNVLLREAVSAARMRKQIEDQPKSVDNNCARDQKGNLALVTFLSHTIMLILTESTLYFLNLTAKFRSKKFSMSGQINNWRDKVEPDSKQESSRPASVLSGTTQSVPCSTTSKLSCATAATTFSSATEPPPTPTKTSGSADYADVSDNDQSDSDSEERAAAITSKGKGKAGMKVSCS
jgi:hypothetical protein